MENIKLKPCPFCGSEAVLDPHIIDDECPSHYCWCPQCGARSGIENNEFAAVSVWNTRAQESAIKGG